MIKKILILFFIIYITPSFSFAVSIDVDKRFYINGYTSDSCYTLKSLEFSKKGYVIANIDTAYGERCAKYRKIYYIETRATDFKKSKHIKKNTIRKVVGISENKISEIISLHVFPETSYITINANTYYGKIGKFTLDISLDIEKLKLVNANKNWLKELSSSEEKLVEKKNSDKTPPQISIFNLKNNQKLDTYKLFVRGKVTDNRGILSVFVNGKKSGIKSDGTFASKVKLGLGKNKIKIQAEDVNNNVSEKSLTIIREEYISELTLADVDIPPKTQMNNPDALAVVIRIENYQYVPDATYAYNDAEVFREYLSQTLGFKKQRIKLATNSRATQAEINKLLGSNGWLSRNIVKAKSDVVVYFSGHGIANQNDKTTGVLPFDVDPNYSIGLSLKKLYKDLSLMGAKSVTVFLDTCFSGQSREANMLIADARPIVIVPKEKDFPDNINIFSASTGSQISGAIKEKEHGLFTYYLLKGLSGDSDINKDKIIEFSELSNFVSVNVKKQAAINGREQTPQFINNTGKVFVNLN